MFPLKVTKVSSKKDSVGEDLFDWNQLNGIFYLFRRKRDKNANDSKFIEGISRKKGHF